MAGSPPPSGVLNLPRRQVCLPLPGEERRRLGYHPSDGTILDGHGAPPEGEMGDPGIEEIPLVSAFLKVLKAALLSLPTGETPLPTPFPPPEPAEPLCL